MPIDYVLLKLPCWKAGCLERFDVFTDLSNHHLDAHERDLHGASVAVWLEQEVTAQPLVPVPPAPEGLPGDCYVCQHDRLASLVCSRCGPTCPACAAAHVTPAPEVEAAPAPDALCTCGCRYDSHRLSLADGPGHPCLVCYCCGFALASAHPQLPAEQTAIQMLRRACIYAKLSWREDDARALLETLGVPPDAPAAAWWSAINESFKRWQDHVATAKQEDTPCP